MLTLGLDTSNYATSLAVFDTDAGEVVCDAKQFLPVRRGQLGLRQSDAVFHHTAALPALLEQLGRQADLTQIGAVGVSEKPRPVEGSYMPCFLTGVSAATAFALARGVPLVRTTHQQGHIAAALFAAAGADLFDRETLVFHVSGGTTDLLHCRGAVPLAPTPTSGALGGPWPVCPGGTPAGATRRCGYVSSVTVTVVASSSASVQRNEISSPTW